MAEARTGGIFLRLQRNLESKNYKEIYGEKLCILYKIKKKRRNRVNRKHKKMCCFLEENVVNSKNYKIKTKIHMEKD